VIFHNLHIGQPDDSHSGVRETSSWGGVWGVG